MPRMQDRRPSRHRTGREGTLGARLRRVRDRQGLSLGTVASMLNVPREQLQRIEAGALTSGPWVDRVARWLSLPPGAVPRR